MARELTKAVAYLRTSSKTNCGPDKDSDKRQFAAITRYAKSAGYEIVATFYDVAVSGADPVAGRPEFARMLSALLANGARTIIVELPDRFTRDLAQQLLGHKLLADQGLTLIAASAPIALHRGYPDRDHGEADPRQRERVREDDAGRQA